MGSVMRTSTCLQSRICRQERQIFQLQAMIFKKRERDVRMMPRHAPCSLYRVSFVCHILQHVMACDSSDGDRKKKKIERGVAASEAKQQPQEPGVIQSVKPSLPWPYAFPDDTGFSFMTYFFT